MILSRLTQWWIKFIVLVGVVSANQSGLNWLWIVAIAIISWVSLKEYLNSIGKSKLIYWCVPIVALQILFVRQNWGGMIHTFIPFFLFAASLILHSIFGRNKDIWQSVITIQWGLLVYVFGNSQLARILQFLPEGDSNIDGNSLLVFIVFLTELNDLLYEISTLISNSGQRLLRTNWNVRTWEGLILSSAITSTFAWGMAFLSDLSVWFSLSAGLLVSLASFGGDFINTRVIIERRLHKVNVGNLFTIKLLGSLPYTAVVFYFFIMQVSG